MTTHSNIRAWRIPWTELPHGYSPWGHKESDTTEQLTFSLSPSPLPVSGKYQSTFEFSRFAFLDILYRQKHQCSLLCLACFIQHNVFEVYLFCFMDWYSIPFYCWILFCGMATVHFVYLPSDLVHKDFNYKNNFFKVLKPFRLYNSYCYVYNILLQIHDSIFEDKFLEEDLQSQLLWTFLI